MTARNALNQISRATKTALVLIILAAGVLGAQRSEAFVCPYPRIDVAGPAPVFRYVEYGTTKELQIAFNLGWRYEGRYVSDASWGCHIVTHASGYLEYRGIAPGWIVVDGTSYGPTWHVIRSATITPESDLEEVAAELLHSLHFYKNQYGQEIYDPAISYQTGYVIGGFPEPNPVYLFVAHGTINECWCACIPEPVPDCAKPYVPLSVGPLSGTYHNGGAWGGANYTLANNQGPPNTLLGTNASLDYPQLLWSHNTSSGTDIYSFRHGAMETTTFANVLWSVPAGGILHSSGSALLWTYVDATSEHKFTSKSRAAMYFGDSGSQGYQHVNRIVAANGVDKLYYTWDGDRPSAIYSNALDGKSYKTCISYNGDGLISSVNENVLTVSGDWPYTDGSVLWSRTTTVEYVTTVADNHYISTINHPGGLTTTFGYDGDPELLWTLNLTSVTYPYGHSQHFVYSGNKVSEYYEDGALKNNYRTYTFSNVADLDPTTPSMLFYTEVAHRKPDSSVISTTRRYHDGWRLRGHSAEVLWTSGSTPLTASKRIEEFGDPAGRMIQGRGFGSGSDDFFLKSAVQRTDYGSPKKIYAHVFSSADGGYAAGNEDWLRATMEYATPDEDTPNFETLTKMTTYVGRETNAEYWTTGADDSFKYNLKSVWLNDDSANTVDYVYYGDSDGDNTGLVKKVTNFDGTYAEYEYNDRRLWKVYAGPSVGTKKQVLQYTYNDGSNGGIPYDAITAITDVNGKTTTFDYDVLGRVTSVTIPADGQGGSAQTWSYAYGTWGTYNALQVTVTRPDTKTVVYQYNPDGSLATVDAPNVGPNYMITGFAYDGLGRLLKLTDAGGNETLWSYDAAGRVMTETIKGDGAAQNVWTYGYNPDGQIAHITDPLGQTFAYTYDDDNRLTQIVMTDAGLNETTKTIDYTWNTTTKTQLWAVSVGSDSVSIKYNEHGLLEYVDGVLPDSAAGDPDLVRYAYDDDYRLSELSYAIYDSGQTSYVMWTTDYAYDEYGRLTTISDQLDLETEYAYNDEFTLKSLTLPNGTVTEYTYDDLRRLVSIATTGLSESDVIAKFTYQYNELGLRDKVTMADGRTVEWSYDDVGRLVQEHFKSAGPDPATLLRYVYAYDAAGNRTSKKTDYDDDNGSFAATATYTNNGYNQLTGVSGNPGRGTKVNVTGTIPTAWTLGNGDVTVTPNSTPANAVDADVHGRFFIARNVPLSSGTNSLEAATSADTLAGNSPSSDTVTDVALDTSLNVSFTYNANGDLTRKLESVNGHAIQWDYTYSVEGWLTNVEKKVDDETALTEEYFYDPLGRKYRTVTTEDTESTERYFVYDGGSIILELEEDSGDYLLDKEHVRGPSLGGGIGGLLYTRSADGSVGYFHYDGQGNVVSVTNAAREEIAYYEYDAWGNVLTSCGSLSNEFRFSTKQASNGTGLIDFGYRHYDPTTARWTQRDPLRLDGAVNLYGYCFSQPPGFVDPDGLKARTVGGAAAEFVAFTGGGALGGSVFGPVGTVVGGVVGAGLWALQQFATDHEDYIEDMSPVEAASTIVMDFCYGAVGGYLGGYAYATLSQAYVYYTAAWGAASTATAGSGPPPPPRSLGGGPRDVGVYLGTRQDQNVYAGVTDNFARRQVQWGCQLRIDPIKGAENLTRSQARAIEQVLIEQNPHFENKINSIAPSNPIYNDAVQWGRDMLNWLSGGGGG